MSSASEPVPTDSLRLVGSLTTLVAVALPIAAILTADARNVEVQPGVVDWVFVGAVAAVTITTFTLLVPWCLRGGAHRLSRSAIGLSASAFVLSSIFFWTMVPVAFGTAGTYLALQDHRRSGRTGSPRGLAAVAIVLGTVAALGSVVAYVATS